MAQELLQTMGIRSFSPLVISCPGCGRTTSTYFQELAGEIQGHLRKAMPDWKKKYNNVEDMTVAVMGCVVLMALESQKWPILVSAYQAQVKSLWHLFTKMEKKQLH